MGFLKKLESILPPTRILSKEESSHYASDWSRVESNALGVVLPETTEEVSQILKFCSQEKVAVVPSGGRTGLVGGAAATNGELILSLERMKRMFPVDEVSRTVRVQAGVVTESVHEHCAKSGLTWPIDLAAKGSSQIGGNLSTNAGGVRVIRYGMTRKWVSGIQAVLMDGSVLDLQKGLEKNNCGYDLMQLILGSEGTLAVVTEAILKLAPLARQRKVVFFGLKSISEIESLFLSARNGHLTIQAFEFFSERCLSAVESKLKRTSRLAKRSAYYALMETETADSAAIEAWLETVLESSVVEDGLIANSESECQQVWSLREGITESIALTGPVKKFDVSVPLFEMRNFLTKAGEIAKKFRFELFLFGHFGDGSPHLNLVKPQTLASKDYEEDCKKFEAELFSLLLQLGGAVSSEHGMGLLRKNWLTYSRSPRELNLMRQIKTAFDPMGLLNPGKVL